MNFVPVRCPTDNAVLFEAQEGARETSRHLCRKCGKAWTVDGTEVWQRSAPVARLASCPDAVS